MLDGILLEKAGVPSASIVTDVFEVTGRAMAEQWGLPYYKFLAMPHPIANLTGHCPADPALFERAVGNLVDNALRFPPDGGEIEIAPPQASSSPDQTPSAELIAANPAEILTAAFTDVRVLPVVDEEMP